MYGGGGGSAPAPDYTKEKSDFASTEGSNRKAYADAYNKNVADYTTNMNATLNAARGVNDAFKGLSIKDTAKFDTAERDLNYYINSLGAMQYNEPKQSFDSVVQSPYGSVSVTTPTLSSVDFSGRDALLGELRSTLSKVGTLRNQYGTEEDKIRQAGTSLTGALSGLQSGLSRATISDLNALNEYQRQLDQFKTQAGSFYSPISDVTSLDDNYMNTANNSFKSIEARLNDLYSQRAAEEQRIKDYEASLLSQADQFDSQIGGLSIADEAKINELQRQIDNYQRQAGRFSSALSFDLGQELGDLQSVEDRLSALRAEREAELGRVNYAKDNFNRLAQDLARSARGASIYDQGYLDDLATQASNLRGEVTGFSSKLPADFAGVLAQLAQAEQAAQAVGNRRNTALDRIQSRFDQALTGVGDIAAYDEAALNDRLYRLNSIGSELSRFTGGRADEMSDTFTSGIEQIDSRLRDLSTRRSQLEKQAQVLLNNVKNASYTGLDQAAAGITEAEKLKSEIDLYNAQQAIDEISSIMQRLTSEKSRLERDAQNVADRQSVEQNEILRAISGLGGDTGQVGANMTAAEYLALLQKKKQEEDAARTASTISSFANALGIAA